MLLFIIRVKRELKRVYRNGCRYNERLNAETGGSKTRRIHWVARVLEEKRAKNRGLCVCLFATGLKKGES